MSEPTAELIEALFRDEIRDARRMPSDEKLRLAGDLFDQLCQRMRDGIRMQFPNVAEQRVEEVLRQRLELARRLEQGT